MNIKKVLSTATAAAVVATLGVAAVASAAVTFSISADRGAAMPGDAVTISATGECTDADGVLTLLVDGVVEAANTTYSGDVITYTVPESNAGLVVGLSASCAADGVELGASNALALNIFGADWVVSDPELFPVGEPVTISAGDFIPGAQVTLSLTDQGGAERFSATLGTAGDDYSVSGQVTFPADLEPGEYMVRLTDGTWSASASLTVHPEEEPEPTQSPSPDPEPTSDPEPEPTTDPVDTPTPEPGPTGPSAASAQPGPGASPGRGGTSDPGLPATGN